MATGPSARRRERLREGHGVAFLASQVGALSSRIWNRSVEKLTLDSRTAMLLWNVAVAEGRTQREMAAALHVPGTRIVEMVDELEERGLVERRMRPGDRRMRELHLTARGRRLVDRIVDLGEIHETEFTAGLSASERNALIELLTKLAAARGLMSTAHPDF
jgi:MarR family transcriptional regulator for hemolysin